MRSNLALVFAGGRQAGSWGGKGRETGVPQIEQDGGLFSLGVTDSSVDQQCRTDFCAPKHARDSFNLTASAESRFSVDDSVVNAEG